MKIDSLEGLKDLFYAKCPVAKVLAGTEGEANAAATKMAYGGNLDVDRMIIVERGEEAIWRYSALKVHAIAAFINSIIFREPDAKADLPKVAFGGLTLNGRSVELTAGKDFENTDHLHRRIAREGQTFILFVDEMKQRFTVPTFKIVADVPLPVHRICMEGTYYIKE